MFRDIITQKSIAFILALGLGLRLINLNQSLWLDEAITALAVKNNSFTELITKFSPGDFHPPFYYLFLKFWTNIFGYSEIALRLPSVVFGILTVYFIYKIGGKKAAVLMAVNPLSVYYSQEARMYSLVTMLITAAVWAFLNKNKKLFILALTAALYSDYVPWLMFPVFLSQEIFWVILGLVPLTPLLFIQIREILGVSGGSWGDILGRASFKNLFLVPAKFIFGRISLPQWGYAIFTAFYTGFLLKSKNKIYWSWLLAPLILGFIISIKIPIFTYFRFLFVLPAFILLLSQNSQKVILFITVISLGSLVYFNFNPRFWREDWRAVTLYINSVPGKVLMPNLAQSAPLEYYGAIMNGNKNPVYLLRYVQEIFDPEDKLRKNLETAGYKKTAEKSFNGVLVWTYESRN